MWMAKRVWRCSFHVRVHACVDFCGFNNDLKIAFCCFFYSYFTHFICLFFSLLRANVDYYIAVCALFKISRHEIYLRWTDTIVGNRFGLYEWRKKYRSISIFNHINCRKAFYKCKVMEFVKSVLPEPNRVFLKRNIKKQLLRT